MTRSPITPEAALARPVARLAYIDGLRGVAIAMVLAFHAWRYHIVGLDSLRLPPRNAADFVLSRGHQGVSLFFVLSGFCLSYPLLRRQYQGQGYWFKPSDFFARRCLRILPPYYVALVLFMAVGALLPERILHELSSIGGRPTAGSIVTHFALIHNLLPHFAFLINGSFWSLGLEWQWYWLFPLLFLLCLRSPVAGLSLSFAGVIAWRLGMGAIGFWSPLEFPARLVEFSCGIVTAQLIMRGWRCPRLVLAMTVLLAPAMAEWGPPLAWWPLGNGADTLGLRQPLWGVAFAALIVLGYSSRWANAVLSWRPLVGLGTISYSVYLVHEPIVEGITQLGPHTSVIPSYCVAVVTSIGAGLCFHTVVERPFLSKAFWTRSLPVLCRLLAWTDKSIPWLFANPSATFQAGPK